MHTEDQPDERKPGTLACLSDDEVASLPVLRLPGTRRRAIQFLEKAGTSFPGPTVAQGMDPTAEAGFQIRHELPVPYRSSCPGAQPDLREQTLLFRIGKP
jgi:hypothetical protein